MGWTPNEHHTIQQFCLSRSRSRSAAAAAAAAMASVTIASNAFILSSVASSVAGSPLSSAASQSKSPKSVRIAPVRSILTNKPDEQEDAEEQQMWRRSMVVGAGAVILSVFGAGSAKALEKRPAGEVKPGSKEAHKKYASICVSQPQASICHG